MLKTFPCSGCGACCKRIDKSVQMLEKSGLNLGFPYKWDENGVCEKLIDNKCSVYENRPVICNIDLIVELYEMDKKKFYNDNIKICNQLIKEDNLPSKFLIPEVK
jgi:Fe-S-cluster containining protein